MIDIKISIDIGIGVGIEIGITGLVLKTKKLDEGHKNHSKKKQLLSYNYETRIEDVLLIIA